jgi:cation/acetate symporter
LDYRLGALRGWLFVVWLVASFGVAFFADDLQWVVAGWPVAYWFAAQGSLITFTGIVAIYAWRANRLEARTQPADAFFQRYTQRIHRRFFAYVLGFLLFLAALAVAESLGLRKIWVGAIFLFSTVFLYAVIGIYSRTSKSSEYYVAGRKIPAVYNGMAVAADWMSAASFISMAGGLYLQGFSGSGTQPGGLVYVMGWTGGFCLLALFVAPYLRSMELYTIPDYFRVRYGGRWPRWIAAFSAVLCSFTYVVAQIYGVGLITSRLTGVQFEIGILLGLGGVLVCSFLGGMRAVTWTQVTQYVVLILAFLIPVSWLAYKQLGNPLAPVVYGQQLHKIAELEDDLSQSPAEQAVIAEYAKRARDYATQLQDVPKALERQRQALREDIRRLSEGHAGEAELAGARRALATLPRDEATAREVWSAARADYESRARPLGGMPAQTRAFAGNPDGNAQEKQAFDISRRNFIALMFCLMVGTMGLPHLLTRFYTTPSVAETRNSVTWSLLFISLLYLAAPALAVLVKFEIMAHLVGRGFDELPLWIAQWAKVDPSLISVGDINGDKVLQFAELRLGPDIVMLATPEIGGLPYVISGLVAAGGMAAALSTADGLLLTIGNALSHDLADVDREDRTRAVRRVMVSKFALLLMALLAAYVAAKKPADILFLVSSSFSIAGAAFVPAMVLGIFWRGSSRVGAVLGMLSGLAVTAYYMLGHLQVVRGFIPWDSAALWWGVEPISAGVFGVPAGFAVTLLGSWLWPDQPGAAAVVDRAPRH